MHADRLTRRSLLSVSAGTALQRSGYAAWSWDRWRAITGEQPPQLTTDQAGRAQLSDLLGQGTTTLAAWTARRVELRRVIDVFLGRAPSAPPLVVLVCPCGGEAHPARFRLCGFWGTPLAVAAPAQECR